MNQVGELRLAHGTHERAPRWRGDRPRRARLAAVAGALLLCAAAVALVSPGASAQTSTPTNVPVSDQQVIAYQGQWIARDPARSRHLAIAYDNGSNNNACYLATSTDNGATWSNVTLFGAGGRFALPSPFVQCFYPSITYGPDGTLYYGITAQNPSGNYPLPDIILVATSTDGGATFTSPVRVDPSTTTVSDLNVRMAVDPVSNRLYATFDRQALGKFVLSPKIQVFVSSSTDHGQTFSTVAPVTASNVFTYLARPDVGPDGRLYIAYIDATPLYTSNGKTPNVDVDVVSSTNAGSTLTAPVTALQLTSCLNKFFSCQQDKQGNYDLNNSFSAAAGPMPGQFFVTGTSQVGALLAKQGPMRMLFTSTSDGGATWSPATTFGTAAGGTTDDQLLPSVAVDPQDNVSVVYYELQQPSGLYDVFLTTAAGGSSSFSAPLRITSVSLQEFAPFGIDPFTGGDLAAATTGGVYAAWTDTRRGTPANSKEDVFFATTVAGGASSSAGSASSPGAAVPVPATGRGVGLGGVLLLLAGGLAFRVAAASRAVRRR